MSSIDETTYREWCPDCRRPKAACWCRHVVRTEARTHVVFLQHPRESRVAIGTARMAHVSLPGSELHIGADFSGDPRVRELVDDPSAALLFPGPDATDLAAAAPHERPKTLVVVDGTWANARKLVLKDPLLSKMRRVEFQPSRESRYRIRKEPNAQSVSTIEATVEALGLLEDAPDRFRRMLDAFDAMIDLQIEKRDAREGASRYGRHRKTDKLRPLRALNALRERLVIVSAEGDAHAGERSRSGLPKLVQLVAFRPSDGQVFEAFCKPDRPVDTRVHRHAELAPEVIDSAPPASVLVRDFRSFLRDSDVIATWGSFPFELLGGAGLDWKRRTDLRIVASEWLHHRPGAPSKVLGDAAGIARGPIGRGRAGRVLGELAGLVDAWARLANEEAA